MTSKFFNISLGIAALWAVACNPYNPDLPDEPFRCGTSEPRCPDGYKCDERSPAEQICILVNADSTRPDAAVVDAGFLCNDDSQIDDNNTIDMATQTPIPATQDEYDQVGLAICPSSDVDIFSFRIDVTGKNVVAEIEFDPNRAPLAVDILDSSGDLLLAGMPVEGSPSLARAAINNMPVDEYFVRVTATADEENNYSLSIVTSGP